MRTVTLAALTLAACDAMTTVSPYMNVTAPVTTTLRDVPHKDLWFGFWGSDSDVYDFSSLVWDNVSDDEIDQRGGPNLRFMYPVYKFFCQGGQETGKCEIFSDFQDRWNAAVPKMTQLLNDQKILGFFAGDEVICHSGAAGPSDTIVNTVRNSFPRGKAIIWLNECGSTWPDHSVPENADWLSADHYRSHKDDDYIGDVKNLYNNGVFKKMHSHQKVVLIPGAGHPKDNYKICDDKCTCEVELKDAKDFVDWAHEDSRVAGIMPYAWMRGADVEYGLNEMSDNGDLKKFYTDLGRSTK